MERVLRSIDLNFEHIVAIIEETKDLEVMTIKQLLGLLEAYEETKKKVSWNNYSKHNLI
uniref:Retrovirus-related Pol polyprotein from transposon TNT 1-94 n=1 Tax=Cajanus cajan TaxID=3821 RepID=A0A151SX23_CAJCA|nr:hypothetical protein KK1_014780 [Cajanus cajan]